jgi:general secretion pathway protein E/type IV pilus assembly protein PilB
MIRHKIRIGDTLVEKGLISAAQLQSALAVQKESNFSKKLGQVLVDDGAITQRAFIELLASQLTIDFIDLFGVEVDFNLMASFQISVLKNADAIPFKEDSDYIHVAVSDPLNSGNHSAPHHPRQKRSTFKSIPELL